MNLGIISWIEEKDFARVKEKGLSFVELDVNNRAEEFLEHLEEVKQYSEKYALPVTAVGRWGSDRICETGIRNEELDLEYKLIDALAQLCGKVYITGCNYVEALSYYENCSYAIAYFEKLIAYGKERGIKIATYNCSWNNFVRDPMAFRMIHGHLKDLYIKYDPSHCINAGGDFMQETADWGDRFAHVHIKGSLYIGGVNMDHPPAGLDQTNWGAFIALLYAKGYEGDLSIEPHSRKWTGEIGEKGVDYTIAYIKKLLL